MSALRIRYEIVSIRDRYETHKILPEDALHLAVLTQDAFDDWSHQYPKDDWLASTGYAFAKLYAELPGADARARAVTLYRYVKSQFPTTKYAAESRDALHRGVPVRPDPAWAAQRRTETPTPSAPPSSATPSGSPVPTTSSSPSPVPSPTASGYARPSD
jgi:hypothetical protein